MTRIAQFWSFDPKYHQPLLASLPQIAYDNRRYFSLPPAGLPNRTDTAVPNLSDRRRPQPMPLVPLQPSSNTGKKREASPLSLLLYHTTIIFAARLTARRHRSATRRHFKHRRHAVTRPLRAAALPPCHPLPRHPLPEPRH